MIPMTPALPLVGHPLLFLLPQAVRCKSPLGYLLSALEVARHLNHSAYSVIY